MDTKNERFSLGRACETCRYWDSSIETALPEGGECRYGSPALGQDKIAAWPATHANEWCRCWKSDAETSTRKLGRPVQHKTEDLLPLVTSILFDRGGLGRVDIYRYVFALRPLSFSTFCKLLDALVESAALERIGSLWWVKGQKAALEAEEANAAPKTTP